MYTLRRPLEGRRRQKISIDNQSISQLLYWEVVGSERPCRSKVTECTNLKVFPYQELTVNTDQSGVMTHHSVFPKTTKGLDYDLLH